MQELDVLFYSERNQTQNRSGIQSWRLPSLLGGVSKGNDVEIDPELISVDETQWFNFFKRARWFDLRVDGVAGVPNPHPDLLKYHNNWWTADNPAIWSKLRIVMELMNRIVSTIVEERHPWLDTILFSEIRKWSDIDPELADYCNDNGLESPEVMLERPMAQRATAAEMRARLEQLLQNFIMGFLDEDSSKQNSLYGFTTFLYSQASVNTFVQASQGNIQAVLPALRHSSNNSSNLPVYVQAPQSGTVNPAALQNVGSPPAAPTLMPFQSLVNQAAAQMTGPNGTPMNAAALAATAAASGPVSGTLIAQDPENTHVSAFHVAALRCLLNTQSKPAERYFALASIAHTFILPMLGREAGNAFEMTYFDGLMDGAVLNDESVDYAPGANTVMSYMNWPHSLGRDNALPERWTRQLSEVQRHSVPPLWSTCLFSEEYWQTVVKHWGQVAFRHPKVLLTRTQNSDTHYGLRMFSARVVQPRNVVPEMSQKYVDMQKRWVGLTNWNRAARPWWQEQYRKWSLSPWSHVEARRWISQFCEAHARRDLIQCTKLVWAMIDRDGVDQFDDPTFKATDGPAINLWRAIAGLMMASMPVLAGQANYRKKAKEYWLWPSISASLKWTQPLTFHPATHMGWGDAFEHAAGPWLHPKAGLNLFWTRFAPMAMAYPIPHVWLEACYNAFRKLSAHHAGVTDPNQWSDFDFKVPAYDDRWASVISTGVDVNYFNTPICSWTASSAPTGVDADYYVPSPPQTPTIGNQTPPWKRKMKKQQQAYFDKKMREWQNTNNQQQQQQQQQQLQQLQQYIQLPPGSIPRRPRTSRSRSRSRARHNPYPVHYSTGEVGNNMDDEGFWNYAPKWDTPTQIGYGGN
ncbi:hypothetical protein PG985_003594 [Apiospora marii]|uniref:uncharacterized protein n=1 Tax=Apiospora marii TaxID=335849 RepID=UPI0031328B7C